MFGSIEVVGKEPKKCFLPLYEDLQSSVGRETWLRFGLYNRACAERKRRTAIKAVGNSFRHLFFKGSIFAVTKVEKTAA